MAFDSSGGKFVSASADGTARVYNTMTGVCLHTLIGHEGEISKVSFNPQGTRVITASSDKSCRCGCVSFVWACGCVRVWVSHMGLWVTCLRNWEKGQDSWLLGPHRGHGWGGTRVILPPRTRVAGAHVCETAGPVARLCGQGWDCEGQ